MVEEAGAEVAEEEQDQDQDQERKGVARAGVVDVVEQVVVDFEAITDVGMGMDMDTVEGIQDHCSHHHPNQRPRRHR